MVKYKVAKNPSSRGISYHRNIKSARKSRDKVGEEYGIYRWIEGSIHYKRGLQRGWVYEK